MNAKDPFLICAHDSEAEKDTKMATVKLYNYARTLRSQSEYAKQMQHLSKSIFGEVTRPTAPTSMRVEKILSRRPYQMRKEIVEYYPAHDETAKLFRKLRLYGLYRDEHEDFKDEMERLRELRGKTKRRRKPEEVLDD